MPINRGYSFSKIGRTINGVRLRFTIEVVPPHCTVLQRARTRGWLSGSDWEGEDNEEEWKFGEFWEAWVVGKDPPEDAFSVQGDWLAEPGWVLETCTQTSADVACGMRREGDW
jgi:hypothetical protein